MHRRSRRRSGSRPRRSLNRRSLKRRSPNRQPRLLASPGRSSSRSCLRLRQTLARRSSPTRRQRRRRGGGGERASRRASPTRLIRRSGRSLRRFVASRQTQGAGYCTGLPFRLPPIVKSSLGRCRHVIDDLLAFWHVHRLSWTVQEPARTKCMCEYMHVTERLSRWGTRRGCWSPSALCRTCTCARTRAWLWSPACARLSRSRATRRAHAVLHYIVLILMRAWCLAVGTSLRAAFKEQGHKARPSCLALATPIYC